MYIHEVHAIFEDADTFFPHFDKSNWHEVQRIKNKKDEKHKFEFDFVTYERKNVQ